MHVICCKTKSKAIAGSCMVYTCGHAGGVGPFMLPKNDFIFFMGKYNLLSTPCFLECLNAFSNPFKSKNSILSIAMNIMLDCIVF